MSNGNPFQQSDYTPIILNNTGLNTNIKVIDPNPIGQIVPQEDLFIYVSLKAKQKSKSVLTEDQNTTGGKYNLNNDVRGSIEMTVPQQKFGADQLFSNKPFLTTDWTQIGGNPDQAKLGGIGNDFETFGITNVDIEIKSQTVPKVVIDFVDVRGATLFEQGSCSPYGLFFTLPYPIFELTLKGYYGRPVKYYLNLLKFNAKFNSDTGNMECRAEFVGWSFAFLSDTIVSYVTASQYLDQNIYTPNSILEDKYENTWKFYTNPDNPIVDSTETNNPWCKNKVVPERCTTIFDLVKAVKNLQTLDLPDVKGSPEWTELQNLNGLKNYYNNYDDAVQKVFRDLKTLSSEQINSTANGQTNNLFKLVFKTKPCAKGSTVTDNCDTKLRDLIVQYFDKTSGSLASSTSIIKTQKITDSTTGSDIVDVLTDAKADVFNGQPSGVTDKIYNQVGSDFQNIVLFDYGYKNAGGTEYFIDFGYLINGIKEDYQKLNDVITSKKQVVVESLNNIIEERIGFKPSIRNVFTVLLCNTDAFMQILLNIAIKAEQYHLGNTESYKQYISTTNTDNTSSASSTRISANTKGVKPVVYAWPTVYKKDHTPKKGDGKTQGTKEVFPGEDANFSNWVEVRFVEDFITAYIKFLKEIDLINEKKEGRAGFDNYAPLNVLEAPILFSDNPQIYKNISYKGVEVIPKLIGERVFISLDHTHLNWTRLGATNLPLYNWNPFIQGNKINTNLAKILGKVDAWNLLNAQEGSESIKFIQALQPSILGETPEEFINKVKTDLNLETITYTWNNPKGEENIKGSTYIYKPLEGITISDPEAPEPVVIYGDPTKMGVDFLFQIKEESDYNESFQININTDTNLGKDFKTVLDRYSKDLTDRLPTLIGLEKEESPFKIKSEVKPDSKNQSPFFSDARNFIVAGITKYKEGITYDDGAEPTDWWKAGTPSQIKPYLLTYFTVIDTDLANEYQPINIKAYSGYANFLPKTEPNKVFQLSVGVTQADAGVNNLIQDLGYTSFGGIGEFSNRGSIDSFVTTPSWVDNVNRFRTLAWGNTYELKAPNGFTSEETENCNLAYLFLHLLKPTPLVTRGVDRDFDLLYNTTLKFDENKYPAKLFSIKNFNISGGIVKVPKAWILALGAQLWRWRSFVGWDSNNGIWTKPLKGESPKGFDPLAQPGYNSGFGNFNKTYAGIDRNQFSDYLNRVYNGNGNWASKIQKSVFHENYTNFGKNLKTQWGNNSAFEIGSRDDVKIKDANGGNLGESTFAFDYYGVVSDSGKDNGPAKFYTDRIINLDSNKYNWGKVRNFTTSFNYPSQTSNRVNSSTYYYSWPTQYIAPHHIPYIHPIVFYDGKLNIGGPEQYSLINPYAFTQTGCYRLDYQTLMPQTRLGNPYYEHLTNNASFTERSRLADGDLGFVIQNLPDIVKNKIIEYFTTWATSEGEDGWGGILKIIDPVHFAEGTTQMSTYYDNTTEADALDENLNGVAFLLKNDSNTQSVVDKLLGTSVYLVNSTPKIWYGQETFTDDFRVDKELFEAYLTEFWLLIKDNRDAVIKNITDKSAENDKGYGQSSLEDDDIKLSLYRTFKSMTDKWISASPGQGQLFFNILGNGIDSKCGGFNAGEKGVLAAHFQYVNRVMGDIGNDAVIDITKLNQLKDNIKITLYQYISDLLTENEYMFYPLPAYINLAAKGLQENDLLDMFRPSLNFDKVSCGPLFLSMYVGGNSRQLSFQAAANCSADITPNFDNDSFNLSIEGIEKPDEFLGTSTNNSTPGFTAFKVVYGLENQNHFKNIQLDQTEFSETAESLLVVDKLAQQGGTDQSTKGQNLNSVYLTRSYTCTMESLGNMMIQPMMYFDLFGVPMFNGAYLITEVKHNFKPNHATTTFKGTRQPIATIPIVTDAAVAMTLTLKDIKASTNAGSITNAGSSGGGTVYYGTNAGTFQVNVVGVQKTDIKPIADLVASVESGTCGDNYDSYNYYDTSSGKKVLKSRLRCSGGPFDIVPTSLTLGQIKNLQAQGKLFAVGKYQTIPVTLDSIQKKLNLPDSQIFSKEIQEEFGRQLILNSSVRNGLRSWWYGAGEEVDLQKAITDLAFEFASFPKYHQTIKYVGVIGYNSNTTAYCGIGGNGCVNNKFCAYDVAKRLILTYEGVNGRKPKFSLDKLDEALKNAPTKNNPGLLTSPIDDKVVKCEKGSTAVTLNSSSTHVIMGDSGVSTLTNVVGFSTPALKKISIGSNCVGSGVKFLIDSFEKDPIYKDMTYPNVQVFYLKVGTNDAYNTSTDSIKRIKQLNDLVVKHFPNAKKIVLPGTLGWGGVINKTKTNQDNYYQNYVNLGWVYDYPQCGQTCVNVGSDAGAHNSKNPYFVDTLKIINQYRV
jgi:hypothetical protein